MSDQNINLKRNLKLFHLVLFGLAFVGPLIAIGVFGVVSEASGGMVGSTYVFVTIAMLFTAYSYGQMVKAYPLAGSAYTYTSKSINPKVGFMVGWAVLLDYIFIPMVIWLIGGVYLEAAFPGTSSWMWIVGFITITTIINVLGVKLGSNVNILLVSFQLLIVLSFLILSIIDVASGGERLVSVIPFIKEEIPFTFIFSGAAVAAYSFLGFDAISTLSEEAIEPKKNIPRAIFITTFIVGGTFFVTTYFAQLVTENIGSFTNVDSAAAEIALLIGGNVFVTLYLAGQIVTQFAAGIPAQASGARILYAMGRDGTLPTKIFGYIHPKYQTPIINIVLVGIIGLIALLLNVTSATSFVNFGAFTAFIFVNISVIFHYYINEKKRSPKETLSYLVLPLVGASINIWLFSYLDRHALTLGALWLFSGLIIKLLSKSKSKAVESKNIEEMLS